MNSVSAQIKLKNLSDCREKFDEAFEIYKISLPASERKSRTEVLSLLDRKDYRLTIAELESHVVGISIVYVSRFFPISLLDYMATSEACRNTGIGKSMFVHTLATSADRLMFVEVEAEHGSAGEREIQRRRQAWYARLGCRKVDDIAYHMPQLNDAPPPPLNLMYHPNGTETDPTRSQLRSWISDVYSGVYGLDNCEEEIEAMFLRAS